MEATDWESSSGGASDIGDEDNYEQDINDEEECLSASGCLRKLQFRKHASTARWNDQMGMAEVLENKGSLWTTTGIVRCGKIYCSIEETLFLIEVGALHLLDHDNSSLSLKDVYTKVAEGRSGCLWEQFEVYRHLKSLGYIVGKHKVPWSLKNARNDSDISSPSSTENKGASDVKSEDEQSISRLLNAIQLDEVTPIFDVFLPHNKFRKSSPGDPNFMVCLTRGYPPSKEDIEVLERTSRGIPMKYCHVEHGRVCFFSFDKPSHEHRDSSFPSYFLYSAAIACLLKLIIRTTLDGTGTLLLEQTNRWKKANLVLVLWFDKYQLNMEWTIHESTKC